MFGVLEGGGWRSEGHYRIRRVCESMYNAKSRPLLGHGVDTCPLATLLPSTTLWSTWLTQVDLLLLSEKISFVKKTMGFFIGLFFYMWHVFTSISVIITFVCAKTIHYFVKWIILFITHKWLWELLGTYTRRKKLIIETHLGPLQNWSWSLEWNRL